MPEWRQAWRRAVTLYKSTLHSVQLLRANDSQGGESKEKQTLSLFKEELSNNLCSPKMELAD